MIAGEMSGIETRANTGHAVLRSTRKPPKMRRRNGPTDGRRDGRTDRPSYRGASQHLKKRKRATDADIMYYVIDGVG